MCILDRRWHSKAEDEFGPKKQGKERRNVSARRRCLKQMSFAVCIIRECLSQAHLRSEEGARLIVMVEFFYQKGKNEEEGGQEVVFIPTRGVVKLQSSSNDQHSNPK